MARSGSTAAVLLAFVGVLSFAPELDARSPESYAAQQAVSKGLKGVRRCYRRTLKYSPDLFGILTLGFRVNSKGMVEERWVEISSLGNKTLDRCIEKSFRKVKFAPDRAAMRTVRVSLLLATSKTPPERQKQIIKHLSRP